MTSPKLKGFEVLQTPYKTINNHPIRTDILIPQTLQPGKRPIIVRFHGGGLIMGDSLYMPFFPHWLSDLALTTSAITISPNYRLLPEATTPEIFSDISSFWEYLHSPTLTDLLSSQSPPVEIDLARILLAGDSAGGLLSVSTALNRPQDVSAAIATYPWVDTVGPEFVTPRDRAPFGESIPQSFYDETLAATKGKSAETSLTSEARLQFMLAAIQYGQLGRLYGQETGDATPSERRVYFPMEALEADNVSIPKGGIVILHGKDDSVVPVQTVRRFVKRAREVLGDGVSLTERDGEHGFDSELRLDDEGWLKDALKGAIDAWLS